MEATPYREIVRQWILHAVICYPHSRFVFIAARTAGRVVAMGR